MIPKIAIIAVAISLVGGVWFHGNYHGKKTERLASEINARLAVEKALQQERAEQEQINNVLQSQKDDLATINNQLLGDIKRLQQRPRRRHVPETPRPDCKGASGADLSAQDAEFLVREIARADRLRTALKACYAYADTVTGQ